MATPVQKESRPLRATEKVHRMLYPELFEGKKAKRVRPDKRTYPNHRAVRTTLSEKLHTQKGVLPRLSTCGQRAPNNKLKVLLN